MAEFPHRTSKLAMRLKVEGERRKTYGKVGMSHPVKCPLCSNKYPSAEAMQAHKKTHGYKKIK